MNNTDNEYFRLVNSVLRNGITKKNRTGTDTIGIFGEQAKFDLRQGFPLLTTKRVYFKAIVHELLWFLSGSSNIKYLVDNDVHIWDDWAFKKYEKIPIYELEPQEMFRGLGNPLSIQGQSVRKFDKSEFIQAIKDSELDEPLESFAKKWGELGTGTYGGMWRNFPYYDEDCADKPLDINSLPTHGDKEAKSVFGYVDQIQKVITTLKKNPNDRRMIVSAWHPYWVDHCALPPCHVMFQFHTEELTLNERHAIYMKNIDGEYRLLPKYLGSSDFEAHNCYDGSGVPRYRLNCQLYQRSCDLFLGVPFNIASYALLTHLMANECNMVAGTFVHTYGDLHIYKNHLDQINIQFYREPYPLPTLKLDTKGKTIFDLKYEDIKLENYVYHPTLKGEVAV